MKQTLSDAFQYILRNYHFIASKLFKLTMEIDDSIKPPTACTNGKWIKFHPEFLHMLTHMQIITLIAHEVLHVIFCHHLRMRGRNPELWNAACDYAINLILVSMGFVPLPNWLYDTKYTGWSAEDIYADLEKQDKDQQEKQKQQSKNSGGSFEEPKTGDGQPMSEVELSGEMEKGKVDIQQAKSTVERIMKGIKESEEMSDMDKQNALERCGKGMGELFESIEEFTRTKIDWQAVVNRFIFEKSHNDYTFMKPHPAISEETGFFMPTVDGQAFGGIAMALDVSGSTRAIASDIASESFHCLSQMDNDEPSLQLWYVSTHVHLVETIESPDDIRMVRGGGTAFTSFFKEFKDTEKKGLIFVTDGCVNDMATWVHPPCDVLWILTRRNKEFEKNVPFGEIIYFNQ